LPDSLSRRPLARGGESFRSPTPPVLQTKFRRPAAGISGHDGCGATGCRARGSIMHSGTVGWLRPGRRGRIGLGVKLIDPAAPGLDQVADLLVRKAVQRNQVAHAALVRADVLRDRGDAGKTIFFQSCRQRERPPLRRPKPLKVEVEYARFAGRWRLDAGPMGALSLGSGRCGARSLLWFDLILQRYASACSGLSSGCAH
jgi:hypothetical protein